ncbi:MAG: tyrosine--tRNA ligase [Lachnospirales bacterium]
MSNLFDTLKDRGYIYQSTDIDRIKDILNGEPTTYYLGIDPTADSLHIGHFFALMMFRHLQDHGHKGIIVIGGATALIGDPSGKKDMRKVLTKEQVAKNIEEVKTIVKKFVKTDGDNPAIITNNADWITPYNFIDFMREVGIHFNVNKMLSADAYSTRLEEGGLTFLEMSYMLMQAYDFVHLNRTYGCKIQIGGSDQWGNLVAGVTLNRKLNNVSENTAIEGDLFGLTCPLLMTNDGKKMGKTESGALWVEKDKTSAFDFYQYFYNVNDDDVEMLMKLFTRIDLDVISELIGSDIIKAKKTMAYEITKLVHGEAEADDVMKAIKSLYSGNTNLDTVPSYTIDKNLLNEGVGLLDLLEMAGLAPTKSEGRRNVTQGGVSINGEKVTDPKYVVTEKDIDQESGVILLKRGKKNFVKIDF